MKMVSKEILHKRLHHNMTKDVKKLQRQSYNRTFGKAQFK